MTHSNHYYFTSESVSEGHPDKICDRISDEILDYVLDQSADPVKARCAAEVLATTNHVTIAGEVTAQNITDQYGVLPHVKDDMCDLVRKAVKDIGYEQKGFHWKNLDINFRLHGQSPELNKLDDGAGDQGLMFGYAIRETDELMPAAIHYSHRILQELSAIRRSADNPGFGPDMKSQVTLKYNDKDVFVGVDNVVVSAQHIASFSQSDMRDIIEKVIADVLPYPVSDKRKILINPRGDFIIGGPDGDAGLTGRKIIVDTYGGAAPHGGGAFSGKDPNKVDRSAAYAARYLAKNIVAAELAKKCEIQLSYAIGKKQPTSVAVNTYGTGTVDNATLVKAIQKSMDLTPRGIRKHLNLNRPIYVPTSSYGHFGRKPENGFFPWEDLTLINVLKQNI